MDRHHHYMDGKDVMNGDLMGLLTTGSVLMIIVPMDTTIVQQQGLIVPDIMNRITIEILGIELYNMEFIMGQEVEALLDLKLMIHVMNKEGGNSLQYQV